MAIPGIFPPVIEGETVYVDGGVLNNLPADFMEEFGVSAVIAVDVGPDADGPWRPSRGRMPGMIELLWRVGTLGGTGARVAESRDCDVLIRPAVSGIGIFGWHAREEALQAGYKAVLDHLAEIRAAITK
jgi:NTE family protein